MDEYSVPKAGIEPRLQVSLAYSCDVCACFCRMKDDSSDLSDHEEEFYYTEIEVNVENVTKTFSDMSTSSPPTASFEHLKMPITDHDYQRKVSLRALLSVVAYPDRCAFQ